MTAAAIHLRHIDIVPRPAVSRVMQMPRFDQTPNSDIGKLFFMGQDAQGNNVYIIGLGAQHRSLCHLLDQYLGLLGLRQQDYCLVDCLPCVNLFTRIGGFSSRSLGLVWFGRRLAAYGVSRGFCAYVRLVEKVRASGGREAAFLDGAPPI